jgi:hypothetical protein
MMELNEIDFILDAVEWAIIQIKTRSDESEEAKEGDFPDRGYGEKSHSFD